MLARLLKEIVRGLGDAGKSRSHDVSASTLRRLQDIGETVEHADEDIRGRKVLDQEGNLVGTVDGLLVDDAENKVRFLRIECGGFLGLGATHLLIPVDAITSITRDIVTIDCDGTHVRSAPRYDPALFKKMDEHNWSEIYDHYGYPPYWVDGYRYPDYPYSSR